MASNDNLGFDDLNLNTVLDFEDDSGPTRNLRERKKKNGTYAEDQDNIVGGTSRRERRKVAGKKNYATGGKRILYNNKGILVDVNKDLCDCMEELCPGCHFPCPKCRSTKCGHECRQNRKWQYNESEYDGEKHSRKLNPHIVS